MKVKLKRCYKDRFDFEMMQMYKYNSFKKRLEVNKSFINGDIVEGTTNDNYSLVIQNETYYLSWFIKVGDR